MDSEPDVSGECVVFHTLLEPSDLELETSFLDADGTVICGAYYVYVSRLQ